MSRAGGFAAMALVAALLTGGAIGFEIGSRPPEQRRKEMTMLGLSRQMLLDSLRVTGDQRARIDSLLDQARSRADSAVERMLVSVRGATGEAREGVRASLDPEQRARFDALLSGTSEMLPRTPLPPR